MYAYTTEVEVQMLRVEEYVQGVTILRMIPTHCNYTPSARFAPCHTAKLTAFIGTTFKYPIPSPT